MPSNVEVKARVADAAAFSQTAERLARDGPETLHQHDRFYAVAQGRFKLRSFADGAAELIFYDRADAEGPKLSSYSRVAVPDPEAMHAMLKAALGCLGEVRKRRRVWHVGRTRVHLDEVEGLGTYMELEVMRADGEAPADGAAEAAALLAALGIDAGARVSGAYLDLLAKRRPRRQESDSSEFHGL
ncbi:MAG: class IV adenylate cyclase [Pseudomonadota bacterium]